MATKNLYPSTTTVSLFQTYTRAGVAILNARQLCARLETAAHDTYNNETNLARMEYANKLDSITDKTRATTVRAALIKRDAAIDAATKKRDGAIKAARDAFNETVKNARERQNAILKRVDSGVYAAMLLYNNTGTIDTGAWTVDTRVTGASHTVEKRAIYVEKSLVECIRDTLKALEFVRVNDLTTERFIRRVIVNAAGTRSRGAAGNYTRRGLTRDGFKREIIEYIIGSLTNPRYEYRTEYDAETREIREIMVTIAPRYTIDSDGDWKRNAD